MKRIILGLLMRMFDRSLKVNYKLIDKRAVEDWAYRSFDDKGWRSYFAYEDLKILKEMSFGKERDAYMILIGRRLQLLYLFDEMKKAFENKKSASEKQAAAAKQDEHETT